MSTVLRSAVLPPSAETGLAELWQLVVEQRSAGLSREELRAVAREVSVAARGAAVQPEQLIVAVKQSWTAHPGLGRSELRHDAQWLLTELISLCICEFYRDDATAGAMAPMANELWMPR